MLRLLLFVAAIVVLVWLIRSARRRDDGPGSPPRSEEKPRDAGDREAMVACARCGVHLPRSEALQGRGGWFCGETHRLEFEQRDSAE